MWYIYTPYVRRRFTTGQHKTLRMILALCKAVFLDLSVKVIHQSDGPFGCIYDVEDEAFDSHIELNQPWAILGYQDRRDGDVVYLYPIC